MAADTGIDVGTDPWDSKGNGPSSPMIRVFGGIGVDDEAGPVSIGGPKQRRLLALLAVRSGSVVSIDWLAEYLWNDAERPVATAPAIRTYLSRLRLALPEAARDWIETEPAGYRLNAPGESVEHLRFSMLRAEATHARNRDDPLAAHQLLEAALALWRGEPFRDLEELDWARADIERLHLERLEMLEERWEAALALGRHTQITGELAAFTAEHGERDRAVRQYALALYRSGQTADALRAISEHRRRLADASGLDPSKAMVELEQALFAGDPALDVEKVGRPLRGYRLLEEAGSGAFSVVWRGVQPSVNREVAIKQIRSELATQPEFIRRFEAEAHLVARLEHPHIVPLIDFWRDPDSAYLVMRWLPGGTLERRLDDGPLSVDETMRLVRQVGGALSIAHRQGVVHRDVKTANILFDEEGNAFLADFGIALAATESAGPEAALSPGSPVYASPEQIRGELLGPEADVFSLGVVIFECLTGSLPFPATSSVEEMVDRQLHRPYPTLVELRADVSRSVSDAVALATAKEPRARFRSVAEFIDALEADTGAVVSAPSAGGPAPPVVRGEVVNPYLGLRAFDGGDSGRFFGRERLVHELLDQLRGGSISSRCVVVVGPSGSGKSSVVRAGLVPALRNGEIKGSAEWFTTTMVPGNDPYESLEAALLRIAVNPPPSLLGQLRDGPRGILRGIRRCLGREGDHVALVIDQFEEVFTGRSADDAHNFLDALAVAVEDPTSPLRLVVTLRADYYHRPLEHPTFAPILRASAVDVLPLAADELERAIVDPARAAGVSFEAGLVAIIAAETVGQPSPLPLLQYMLSELFERRVVDRDAGTDTGTNAVTIAMYEELGGLAGALAARSESIYDEANTSQRSVIRGIFGKMTNAAGDTTDLRQRVAIADLASAPDTDWVLDRFGVARLVTFDHDVATREPTVEVAHEALLRQWPRLVGWLDEDRDLLRSAALIAAASTAWDGGGREATDLYRGGRLDSAVDLSLAAPERLRSLDLDFIDVSRRAAEADRDAEAGRVRRLRRLVGGVAAALVVALIAGGVAVRQQQRADGQASVARAAADDAEIATLISRSAAVSADEPDVSLLLALEANRRSPEPASEQAVLNALGSGQNANLVATFPFLDTESTAAADCPGSFISRDGLQEFGVVGGRLLQQDLVSGEVVDYGAAPEPCGVWLGDQALDRATFACCDGGRTWIGSFGDPARTELEYNAARFIASRRLDGDRLVFVQGPPNRALLVDATTGDVVGQAVSGDSVFDVEISGDGAFVGLSFLRRDGSDAGGRIVVLDAQTGEVLQDVMTDVPALALTIDVDTDEVIGAMEDGSLLTADIGTGDVVAQVETSATSRFVEVGVQSDGTVAVVSEGQIELVDRVSGPIGVSSSVRNALGARFRADDSVVVLTSDRRSEVYALDGNALVERSFSIDPLAQVSFNAGQASVIRGPDETPELIDLATGDRSNPDMVDRDGNQFSAVWVYPEADGFWAIDRTGVFGRWKDGEMVERVDIDGAPVTGTRFEDRFAALRIATNGDSSVHLVNLAEGSAGVDFSVAAPNVATAHPALDGGVHVLDLDGTLRTYDTAGALINEVDTGAEDALVVTLDPASGRLAVADRSGGVVLVHPITGDVERLPTSDTVSNLGWARDGALLLITSSDGTIRLWDVERGALAGLMFEGTGATIDSPPWFDPATESIWVASSGTLLQLPLEPARWVERACEAVGRGFTQDEWDRFVPGDEPLQVACQ